MLWIPRYVRALRRRCDLRRNAEGRAWAVSLVVHGGLMALLMVLTLPGPFEEPPLLLLTGKPPQEPRLPLEHVHFADLPEETIGSRNAVLAEAPQLSEKTELPQPVVTTDRAPTEAGSVDVLLPTARQLNSRLLVRGASGVAVRGAVGAVDRITHEILLSLQQGPTLVVWLFDQSGSLEPQREAIRQRFQTIYHELGLLEAQGDPAWAQHKDAALLTSVVAFGAGVTYRTPQPTSDLGEIQQAVATIENDASGKEFVFTAVCDALKRLRHFHRQPPHRNVMLVIFTDEVGDDAQRVDEAVMLCQRQAAAVYVVGVPAPFGRRDSYVPYVDPDPQFNQQTQWVPVQQGPESQMPERIRLHLIGSRHGHAAIDSGFGPYALTRLCVETGGIYFAVHPGRPESPVQQGQAQRGIARFEAFFDPAVMRRYRPHYVSLRQYEQWLKQNRARAALVQAASLSWVAPLEDVPTRFPKQSDEQLAALLTEAQQSAAKLEPKIDQLYNILRAGAVDRTKLAEPRWQAGFDLAYGRVLAAKVRTEGYNAMLAQVKQGMAFQNSGSDTWVLQPAETVSIDSALSKLADEARDVLRGVTDGHPKTPWSYVAQRELETPLGWKWNETHSGVRASRASLPGSARGMPSDDRARMLKKPKPTRKPPAL